jgi:predicted nucleic acid-binding protein
VILLDTSGLLANYDRRDRHHAAAAGILAHPQHRILSPFVLAELDYLVGQIAGQASELMVLEDVARGAYQLEPFSAADVMAAKEIIEQYADLRLGLADASVVVLAERHGCHDLLTLDERHFRTILGPNGRPFRLLPADAE